MSSFREEGLFVTDLQAKVHIACISVQQNVDFQYEVRSIMRFGFNLSLITANSICLLGLLGTCSGWDGNITYSSCHIRCSMLIVHVCFSGVVAFKMTRMR